MLRIFYKDPEKRYQFRTAYVKQDNGIKKAFKYYLLDREDITKASFLKNVNMQEVQKIIRTTATYPFVITSKIIMDGFQYTISAMYTEEQENNNGIFRKDLSKYTYLILKR